MEKQTEDSLKVRLCGDNMEPKEKCNKGETEV